MSGKHSSLEYFRRYQNVWFPFGALLQRRYCTCAGNWVQRRIDGVRSTTDREKISQRSHRTETDIHRGHVLVVLVFRRGKRLAWRVDYAGRTLHTRLENVTVHPVSTFILPSLPRRRW